MKKEEDEAEKESDKVFTPKLPLLKKIHATRRVFHHSPQPSGGETPPLLTPASVPFRWEEEPGKPRPTADTAKLDQPQKCLELPPARLSPTAVLDGPYDVGRPKFSSFRFFRDGSESFDSCSSTPGAAENYERVADLVVVSKKRKSGFLGRSLRWKSGGKEGEEGGFSTTPNIAGESGEKSFRKVGRNGSFSSFTNSRSPPIWAAIYQGLKQFIPWKSAKKPKKEKSYLNTQYVI